MSTAVQSTPVTFNVTTLIVPAISALIGGVFSYAVLKTTVKAVERDVGHIRRDLSDMHTLIQDASVRIARIEGRMERE